TAARVERALGIARDLARAEPEPRARGSAELVAVARLPALDRPVAAREQHASGGVQLALCRAGQAPGVEILRLAGLVVQVLAVAGLARIDHAVATRAAALAARGVAGGVARRIAGGVTRRTRGVARRTCDVARRIAGGLPARARGGRVVER